MRRSTAALINSDLAWHLSSLHYFGCLFLACWKCPKEFKQKWNLPSLLPGLLVAFLHLQHPGRAQHQVLPQHGPWKLSLPGYWQWQCTIHTINKTSATENCCRRLKWNYLNLTRLDSTDQKEIWLGWFRLWHFWLQATTLLGYLNSCLNPIIYTIFNPGFIFHSECQYLSYKLLIYSPSIQNSGRPLRGSLDLVTKT